jgi:hypothetical protein
MRTGPMSDGFFYTIIVVLFVYDMFRNILKLLEPFDQADNE